MCSFYALSISQISPFNPHKALGVITILQMRKPRCNQVKNFPYVMVGGAGDLGLELRSLSHYALTMYISGKRKKKKKKQVLER